MVSIGGESHIGGDSAKNVGVDEFYIIQESIKVLNQVIYSVMMFYICLYVFMSRIWIVR